MSISEPTVADPAPVHSPDDAVVAPPQTTTVESLIEHELLIEEISIDGMCGVY